MFFMMKNEEKQELVKEIVDLIDSENSKDKSNHKDIIEYFFNKRSKKTVDYIKKVEKYIKEEAFFENLTESLQNMIDEIKFLRHRLIDDLNNILSNHGDMSITQFEIDKERRDLSHKVVYDALTSVNTRDFTLQNLRKSIMLFSRNKDRIFTLLMLDIDHFKTINDTYGHVIGDEILKLVGQILNISIRESDVAGRFGGEEFMIILTDTEIKSSLMVADRIKFLVDCVGKNMVEKKKILENLEKKSTDKEIKNINRILKSIEESMKDYHSELLKAIEKMTLSIGVTQIVDDDIDFLKEYGIDKTMLRLVDRADKALYHSKHQGRNSISIRLPEKRIKEIFDIDQCSVLINK